jgi:hypothetical protein
MTVRWTAKEMSGPLCNFEMMSQLQSLRSFEFNGNINTEEQVKIWNQAVAAYPGIRLEKMRETTRNLTQDRR